MRLAQEAYYLIENMIDGITGTDGVFMISYSSYY